MKRSDIPNLITFARILLVVPVVWLLHTHNYIGALAIFALAGFSDALDGFLAKRYGWESRLGSLLDPIADKLLLVCSFLVLGAHGLLPLWLVGLVILRDAVIVTGATVYHFRIQHLVAGEPTLSSKLNTLMQILLVLAVVLTEAVMVTKVSVTIPACRVTVIDWAVDQFSGVKTTLSADRVMVLVLPLVVFLMV